MRSEFYTMIKSLKSKRILLSCLNISLPHIPIESLLTRFSDMTPKACAAATWTLPSSWFRSSINIFSHSWSCRIFLLSATVSNKFGNTLNCRNSSHIFVHLIDLCQDMYSILVVIFANSNYFVRFPRLTVLSSSCDCFGRKLLHFRQSRRHVGVRASTSSSFLFFLCNKFHNLYHLRWIWVNSKPEKLILEILLDTIYCTTVQQKSSSKAELWEESLKGYKIWYIDLIGK